MKKMARSNYYHLIVNNYSIAFSLSQAELAKETL